MSHMPSRGCQCAALGDTVLLAARSRVCKVDIIVGYLITIPPFSAWKVMLVLLGLGDRTLGRYFDD